MMSTSVLKPHARHRKHARTFADLYRTMAALYRNTNLVCGSGGTHESVGHILFSTHIAQSHRWPGLGLPGTDLPFVGNLAPDSTSACLLIRS